MQFFGAENFLDSKYVIVSMLMFLWLPKNCEKQILIGKILRTYSIWMECSKASTSTHLTWLTFCLCFRSRKSTVSIDDGIPVGTYASEHANQVLDNFIHGKIKNMCFHHFSQSTLLWLTS